MRVERMMRVIAIVVLAGCGHPAHRALDGAPPGARIASITVANAQPVLAPATPSECTPRPNCAGSTSINCFSGLSSLADEHSTVFPPGTLANHASDYLFFVPTKTCLNGSTTAATGSTSGLVVLTGGAGPDASGAWTLDFPTDYDLYDETIGTTAVHGHGQIFLSPMDRTSCPNVTDARNEDPTFDLNYANPGSVVVDPTTPGALLMIYEGTNRCIDSTMDVQDNNFYSTIGVATSSDAGHTWPSYSWSGAVPLPEQSLTSGPAEATGTTGRYAVLGAPVTVTQWIAANTALPSKSVGDSEPSAFVDDVAAGATTYIYSVQNANLGGLVYPGTQTGGTLTVARAALGPQPLAFAKWFGTAVAYGDTSSGTFAPSSVTVTGSACGPGRTSCSITNAGLGDSGGGLESPIFPQDPSSSAGALATCQAPAQNQLGGAIEYVEATHEYVLTFICNSPSDPANPSAPPPAGATRGAAWFYSTLDATQYDLSRQDMWSAPTEIGGSWRWFASNGASPASNCVYDGWYPTFMSLGTKPGHLTKTGYAFSMDGCQDTEAGAPRAYTSRTFTIEIAGN